MKHAVLRKIVPGKRPELEMWCAELEGPRRAEAIETLVEEGVAREWTAIFSLPDGDYVLGFMEGPGEFRPANLSREMNVKHRQILASCLDPEQKSVGRFGYDLEV